MNKFQVTQLKYADFFMMFALINTNATMNISKNFNRKKTENARMASVIFVVFPTEFLVSQILPDPLYSILLMICLSNTGLAY